MRFAYPLFCMHGKARERRRLIWRCLTIATQNHLLNEEIREPEVRLISEEGEQLGVMSGEQALRIAGGNRTQAAAMLGIGRRTLYDKLEEYGLETRKTGK